MKTIQLSILGAWLALSAQGATLIHSYSFATDGSDSTGTDNGTLTGGASVSGGRLVLNGSDGYLDFGANLIPGSGSFSVLVSAKLNFVGAPSSYMEMISQEGGHFYMGTSSGGGMRVTDAWPVALASFPSDGDWHVFALTVDSPGTMTRLYIDGTQVNTISAEVGHGIGGTFTRFGRQFDGHGEYFNGSLDDIRIYTGVLSAGEVWTLSSGAAAVPEPLTFVLTGLGLVAVGIRRRMAA